MHGRSCLFLFLFYFSLCRCHHFRFDRFVFVFVIGWWLLRILPSWLQFPAPSSISIVCVSYYYAADTMFITEGFPIRYSIHRRMAAAWAVVTSYYAIRHRYWYKIIIRYRFLTSSSEVHPSAENDADTSMVVVSCPQDRSTKRWTQSS